VLFSRSGGESHVAFRTAPVEPKVEALRYVLSQRTPGKPVQIVAGDWWTYWPLRYLAARSLDVQIQQLAGAAHDPNLESDIQRGTVWYVGFVDNPWISPPGNLKTAADLAAGEKSLVYDGAGRPLIEIDKAAPRNPCRSANSK
jgi:hypothetical protein